MENKYFFRTTLISYSSQVGKFFIELTKQYMDVKKNYIFQQKIFLTLLFFAATFCTSINQVYASEVKSVCFNFNNVDVCYMLNVVCCNTAKGVSYEKSVEQGFVVDITTNKSAWNYLFTGLILSNQYLAKIVDSGAVKISTKQPNQSLKTI